MQPHSENVIRRGVGGETLDRWQFAMLAICYLPALVLNDTDLWPELRISGRKGVAPCNTFMAHPSRTAASFASAAIAAEISGRLMWNRSMSRWLGGSRRRTASARSIRRSDRRPARLCAMDTSAKGAAVVFGRGEVEVVMALIGGPFPYFVGCLGFGRKHGSGCGPVPP
jgi:hypothetical protein